jgi:hypothetical protein
LDRGIWLGCRIDEAALRGIRRNAQRISFPEASEQVSGGSSIAKDGAVQTEVTRSILFSNSERGTTLERSAVANILQTHIGSALTVVHLHLSPYANFTSLSMSRSVIGASI